MAIAIARNVMVNFATGSTIRCISTVDQTVVAWSEVVRLPDILIAGGILSRHVLVCQTLSNLARPHAENISSTHDGRLRRS